MKAGAAKKLPSQRNEAANIIASSDNDNPLPGRKPSAAYIAALQAVAKMAGGKR